MDDARQIVEMAFMDLGSAIATGRFFSIGEIQSAMIHLQAKVSED